MLSSSAQGMKRAGEDADGGNGNNRRNDDDDDDDDNNVDNDDDDLRGDDDRSINSEVAERNHWYESMRTLLMYEDFAFRAIDRLKAHLANIPARIASKLPRISTEKFKQMEDSVAFNQELLTAIVQLQVEVNFSNQVGYRQNFPDKYDGPEVHSSQQHRNEAIINSIYREWSAEAKSERDRCFNPLIEELQRHLPVDESTRFKYRVSVPGCGLARLPIEIASRGYRTEANEFSSFMVMASHFMLNGVSQEKEFYICPWLSRSSNVDKVADATAGFLVPDVAPSDIFFDDPDSREMLCVPCGMPPPDAPRFSFNSGNFVSIYSKQHQLGAWDAVVTCFFIDTAPVIMEYIETIWNMLGEGGIWTNIGPLLYHWQNDSESNGDERYSQSVELSYEELREVIINYGFTFLTELDIPDVTYAGCPRALMNTVYMTKHFTVRKNSKQRRGGSGGR